MDDAALVRGVERFGDSTGHATCPRRERARGRIAAEPSARPSTSSITSARTIADSLEAVDRAMFGCFSAANSRASRSNRCRRSGSRAAGRAGP